MNVQSTPIATELEAALQWWRMAGVDQDFAEDATDWLGVSVEPADEASSKPAADKARQEPEAAPAAKIARSDLIGPNPPTNLEQFRQFWLEAPGLDAIGPRGRVAPRGEINPELMVLVIDPEERDGERLLSGAQGQLLDRIIAAMGLSDSDVYLASALPRHTPMADTRALATGGMDEVTALHIRLVAPKRVLALGANIPPFLGHELTKDISSLREINQNPGTVPLMVSEGLDAMMAMPRLKTRFWRRWMEWSADR